MQAVRLAETLRARTPEAGCRREHERALAFVQCLECAPPDSGALVDVPTEHEVCPGGRERPQHIVSSLEWELARGAPRSARQMVVEDGDAQGAGGRVTQRGRRGGEPRGAHPTALMAPGLGGVEAADDDLVGPEDGLRRPEDVREPIPWLREPGRDAVGKVVVARNSERRRPEPFEERPRLLELGRTAAVREVAARDHDDGGELVAECDERIVERRRLAGAAMKVGDVNQARGHRRTRLYTRSMSEQSPEIFDDLYLGLQAGGALRKQRRGEELTEQEAAALSHWQRLSVWRKVIAVGAFALGTFGLGFTLGGLIFGRRRATR